MGQGKLDCFQLGQLRFVDERYLDRLATSLRNRALHFAGLKTGSMFDTSRQAVHSYVAAQATETSLRFAGWSVYASTELWLPEAEGKPLQVLLPE